jgi:adenosylcobinamide kinase / adenosylcobinamide-phosphate guanylyltransferase
MEAESAMHFVTGGSFNGKSKWVREFYQLNKNPHQWISAYSGVFVPESDIVMGSEKLIVFEGIELWLKASVECDEPNSSKILVKWQQLLHDWLNWEQQEQQNRLILIGTDIMKGIVPMNAEDRLWRDVTGWAYQDMAAAAERVDLIWYGMNQKLK